MRLPRILAAFVGCVIALSATGAASAAIYWTGSGISRAAHDGTNVEDPFIRAIGGSGLAVDGSYLYSPSPGGSPRHASIDRARVDGSGRANDHFILTAGDPRGVAVDGSRVYWTQEFPTFNPLPTYPSAIGRAALDGSQLDQNFIDLGTTRVTDVAVDAAHVYWTWTDCPRGECGGAVGRANVDGSNVEPNFIVTADYPAGLAVDAGHIYWANRVVDAMGNFSPSLAGQSSIGRAGLDGSDVAQNFITGASSATDVAVDEARIYWSNLFLSADDEGSIGAALIDGSAVEQKFIDTYVAGALAVDQRPVPARVACWNRYFPFEPGGPLFVTAPHRCRWYRRNAETYAEGALLGKSLKWNWGSGRATGRGMLKVPGTGGEYVHGRVKLVRPVDSCRGSVFSRLRYRLNVGGRGSMGGYPIYTCRSNYD